MCLRPDRREEVTASRLPAVQRARRQTAGYYAWKDRPASARQRRDRALPEQIEAIHAESTGTYGWPRIHAELGHRGVWVSRKRVARLMRSAGLSGMITRRKGKTTIRVPGIAIGSRASRLHAASAESALGGGPDRDPDVGRQALSRHRRRRLRSPLRRLGDGRAHARRARRRCAADGDLATPPRPGSFPQGCCPSSRRESCEHPAGSPSG
jgi:hypothetical protein